MSRIPTVRLPWRTRLVSGPRVRQVLALCPSSRHEVHGLVPLVEAAGGVGRGGEISESRPLPVVPDSDSTDTTVSVDGAAGSPAMGTDSRSNRRVAVPRKPPVRSYDPDETRRLLLEAALDLFAEKGFSRASMQEVADRAGVTKGAFYHHFATKDDVLTLIHDEFIDRALAAQDRALVRHVTPTAQLAQMAYDVTLICIEYQKHVMVFFRDFSVLTGDVRDAILAKRRRSAAIFEKMLQTRHRRR